MTPSDIFWFVAEMTTYAAVAWWAMTRRRAMWARIALAVAAVVAFAGTWGVFASPTATIRLAGAPRIAFVAAWFALAALAAASAVRAQLGRRIPGDRPGVPTASVNASR